jgi:hypothetical protein
MLSKLSKSAHFCAGLICLGLFGLNMAPNSMGFPWPCEQ